MRNYKQLSQEQRYQIEILKKAGKNQKEIAELLAVSAGHTSRELKRNKGKKGYRSGLSVRNLNPPALAGGCLVWMRMAIAGQKV